MRGAGAWNMYEKKGGVVIPRCKGAHMSADSCKADFWNSIKIVT
jgi:hypothetical protein